MTETSTHSDTARLAAAAQAAAAQAAAAQAAAAEDDMANTLDLAKNLAEDLVATARSEMRIAALAAQRLMFLGIVLGALCVATLSVLAVAAVLALQAAGLTTLMASGVTAAAGTAAAAVITHVMRRHAALLWFPALRALLTDPLQANEQPR